MYMRYFQSGFPPEIFFIICCYANFSIVFEQNSGRAKVSRRGGANCFRVDKKRSDSYVVFTMTLCGSNICALGTLLN